MKKDTYILLFAIVFAWFMIWFFSNDTDITKQLKESENKRVLLENEILLLKKQKDSLERLKTQKEIKYIYLDKQNKNKDDEIKDNVNDVYTLSERELDLSIRQHTHKPYIRE